MIMSLFSSEIRKINHLQTFLVLQYLEVNERHQCKDLVYFMNNGYNVLKIYSLGAAGYSNLN